MSGFYDDASWVLIPEGIKEDVVYAQKPTDGLGDLTFTRASDATRTNSAGVIERTPWNLLQQSETFDNAYWTKVGLTISANSAISPDGTTTADKIIIDNGTAFSSVSTYCRTSALTLTTGIVHNISVYAKADGFDRMSVRMSTAATMGAGPTISVVIDLITGLQTGGTIGTYIGRTPAANGYFRYLIQTASIASATNYLAFSVNDSVATEGNGVDGISIWGAQLVEGTDAKPYFATTNRQDVPRLDYRNVDGTLNSCPRLLLEPQRTNSIRNSTMVGAVAGSPGTIPTNWSNTQLVGLSRQISLGTENGLSYIDYRFFGTATATDNVRLDLETLAAIAATNGQTWSYSLYAKTANGTISNSQLVMFERNSASGFITQGTLSFSTDSSLQRFTFTRTLSGGATVAFVQPVLFFGVTNGAAYDFTIRIAAPQMELGAYATTFIPTTTAAVTRLADSAARGGFSSIIGQEEGTLFVDVDAQVVLQMTGSIQRLFNVSDGTNNNRILINFFRSSGGVSQIETNLIKTTSQASFTSIITENKRYKIAFAYKTNDFVLYINGVQIGTHISGDTFAAATLTRLDLGQDRTITLQQSNPFNQAALFPTRLTNAQLAEITTL